MDIPAVKEELRQALKVLQRRGLKIGARLLAELLVSTPAPTDPLFSSLRVARYQPPSASSNSLLSTTSLAHLDTFDYEADAESEETSEAFLYAKALFDSREYARCAVYLDKAHQSDVTAFSPLNFFLRCYALYLDGERQRLSERAERSPTAVSTTNGGTNPHLSNLQLVISERQRTCAASFDAFASYLHGVVLRDLGRKQEAQAAFLRALRSFPLLAPAWVDLLKLCGGSSSRKSLNAVAPHLPAHWSRPLFTASALVEIQSNAAALVLLRELSGVFPLSTTIQTAVAKALYQARDIQGASTLFAKIRQQDPCLIDGMDCYSNCLYVQGDGPALSGLCRDLIRVDRNRVESCVTAGNFFSLRGSRERAISYFKRALKLDSLTVQQDNGNSGAVASSCWTLLGHEFVEARNTSAAIECYRRGCEASNGRDFRAWFGLGNSYELLRLPSYAAYYYRRACALRPYDPRLWMALGRSYEALERVDAAVACYERGAANDDRTGVSLLRLAKLERSRATAASASAASASDKVKAERYREAAKRHYAAFVALMESNNAAHTSEVAEALLYLAEQALVQNVVVAGGGKRDIEACISFASRVTLMPLAAHAKRARQLLVEAHKLRAEEEAAKGTTKTNTTPSAATGVAAAGGAGGASTAKKQQQDQQQFFLRANPFGRALAGALAAVGISGGGGGGGAAAPNANAASSAAEGGATATAGGVGGPFGGPGAAAGMRATTTLRPHATAGMLKAAKGMGMTQGTTHQAAGKKRMATDDDDNDDDDDDDDGNHDRDALVAEDDGDGDDDDDGFRSAPASSAAAAAAGRPGTAIGARRPAPAPTPTPAGPALNASSGSDGSGMMMEDDDEDEDD